MVQKLENKILNVFSGMDNATKLLEELSFNDTEASSMLLPCNNEKNGALDVLISSNLINNNSINEFLGSKYGKNVKYLVYTYYS